LKNSVKNGLKLQLVIHLHAVCCIILKGVNFNYSSLSKAINSFTFLNNLISSPGFYGEALLEMLDSTEKHILGDNS